MNFDAALNAAWLVVGLASFALALHFSPRTFRRPSLTLAQLAGVFALLGAIFPCISATDDLEWLESLCSGTEQTVGKRDNRFQENAPAFSAPQNTDGCTPGAPVCVAPFLVAEELPTRCTSLLTVGVYIRRAGRSPPSFSVL